MELPEARRRPPSLSSSESQQASDPMSLSASVRSCDVFVGVCGLRSSALRFVKWLRAELELQGVSCFVSDRSRCPDAYSHELARRAMESASVAAMVITVKSLSSPYTIEEIRLFSEKKKKKLIPIFFGMAQVECTARDIIEKRGELWERLGGQLWGVYGGLEEEWKAAVDWLSRTNVKIEANVGTMRNSIFEAIKLIGMTLGRRSVKEKVRSWRNLAAEEFPFPRNDSFVGRKRELLELESLLFGKIEEGGDASDSGEFKTKKMHGKGVACVNGVSGIGKTELLLEFAYNFLQRYKKVLWVSGEARYLRQNYLKLSPFLGVDVDMETKMSPERFEDTEEQAIRRIRKELSRDIPFLLVIDNLESEKDWWDGRNVMELLPLLAGATHVLISTRLPQLLNLKPLRLLYLSEAEAMALMSGAAVNNIPSEEIDALRALEEKVGRLPLALAIAGAILSELRIHPSELLHKINRMPFGELTSSSTEDLVLRHNPFLLQLFEVCFTCFDGSEKTNKLAAMMVQASGWFAPMAIPISLLSTAASKVSEEHQGANCWRRCLPTVPCISMTSVEDGLDEAEASSMIVRFKLAKNSNKVGCIHLHNIIKIYARRRGDAADARAMIRAVGSAGSPIPDHADHIWAACFLLFKFGRDPVVVDLPAPNLVLFIRRSVLPLADHVLKAFCHYSAVLELLRCATESMEAIEDGFRSQVEISSSRVADQSAPLIDPLAYHEFADLRAVLLETRAGIMMRGGMYDVAEQLCRTCLGIKEVIHGVEHPATLATKQILERMVRIQSKT